MLDQNTFTETIREVSEIIRTASEPLSREEILSYFHKMELNEKQQEMVLEYLLKPEAGEDSQAEAESETAEAIENSAVSGSVESKADEELPDSRALQMYMEELEGLSVCAQEELQQLYEALLGGDETVIGKISESWMGRILEQARKLSVAPEDFSDVVQEGNMAFFMKLSELCGSGPKANRGLSAVYVEKELIQTVETAMKAYIQEVTGAGDVENAVVGKVTLVGEARKYLMEKNGQEPSLRELAQYTRMSESELKEMLDLIRKAEERAKAR